MNFLNKVEVNMKKILSIDDSKEFITLVKKYLADKFLLYTYYNFYKIEEIINRIKEVEPDLILLDFNLEDFTAIDVIKEIKKDPRLKNIPVLLITATEYNEPTIKLVKSELNVKGFISKLESMEEIENKINSILNKE